MGLEQLSSRAIIGKYYETLALAQGIPWVNDISGEPFISDQAEEEYDWLGMSPAMREWVGGRNAKSLRASNLIIKNKDYEATLIIETKDIRRDKTAQIMLRVAEMTERGGDPHWASLLSTLILNAESQVCYDGDYFFGTAHAEGDSGTQANLVSVDISALPVGDTTGAHGSTTAPSVGEMSLCILTAIKTIMGFKDDQGEPFNETATSFRIVAGVNLMDSIQAAIASPFLAQGMTNLIPSSNGRDFNLTASFNARLTTLTTKFDVYRTDGRVKPYIRQEEVGLTPSMIAEGSELEINQKKWQFGLYASRNVGYGLWQHACRISMT